MKLRFLKPPRIQSDELGTHERHATWTELFYDLAFVVAIAVLAHVFGGDISLIGFARFAILLTPIWLLWLASTIYADRFDTDDTGHRLAILAQMIGIVGLAAFAADATGVGFPGFVISYIIVQAAIIFNNIRAGKHNPSTRPLTFFYAVGYLIGLIPWIASLFLDTPVRLYAAGAGLLIDFLVPFAAAGQQRYVKINVSHLAERFGLFIIILLGELVVSVVMGVGEAPLTQLKITKGLIGMALVFGFWWIYFNDLNPEDLSRRTFYGKYALKKNAVWSWFKSSVIMYLHLPLTVALVVVGVGLHHAIAAAPGELPPNIVALIGLGASASFVAITSIKLAMGRGESPVIRIMEAVFGYGSAVAAALLVFYMPITTAIPLLGAIAGLCFLQIIVGLFNK